MHLFVVCVGRVAAFHPKNKSKNKLRQTLFVMPLGARGGAWTYAPIGWPAGTYVNVLIFVFVLLLLVLWRRAGEHRCMPESADRWGHVEALMLLDLFCFCWFCCGVSPTPRQQQQNCVCFFDAVVRARRCMDIRPSLRADWDIFVCFGVFCFLFPRCQFCLCCVSAEAFLGPVFAQNLFLRRNLLLR